MAPNGRLIPEEIVKRILSNLKNPRDINKAEQVNSVFRKLSWGGVESLGITLLDCRSRVSLCIYIPEPFRCSAYDLPLDQLSMIWKKCVNVRKLEIDINLCEDLEKPEAVSLKFLATILDLHLKNPRKIEHLTLRGFVLQNPYTGNLLDFWARELKSLRLEWFGYKKWLARDLAAFNKIVDSVAVHCGKNLEILSLNCGRENEKMPLLELLSLISTFPGLRRFILDSSLKWFFPVYGRDGPSLTKMVESLVERYRKFPNRKFHLCSLESFGSPPPEFMNGLLITAMERKESLDAVTELTINLFSDRKSSENMEILSNNARKEEFDKLFWTLPNLEHCTFSLEELCKQKRRNVFGMVSSFLRAYEYAENKRQLEVRLGF